MKRAAMRPCDAVTDYDQDRLGRKVTGLLVERDPSGGGMVDRDRETLLLLPSLGWSIIPLQPKAKIPYRGFPLGRHFETAATSEQVLVWLDQYQDANWGLVLGAVSHGTIALDVDSGPGLRWCLTQGWSGDGLWYVTNRGVQILLTADERLTALGCVRIRPDVEARMDRHISALPPSVHPNGTRYIWGTAPLSLALHRRRNGLAGSESRLAGPTAAPEWLTSLLEARLRNGGR